MVAFVSSSFDLVKDRESYSNEYLYTTDEHMYFFVEYRHPASASGSQT